MSDKASNIDMDEIDAHYDDDEDESDDEDVDEDEDFDENGSFDNTTNELEEQIDESVSNEEDEAKKKIALKVKLAQNIMNWEENM
jgi:hypothetical protein